ncbi:MAG: hypothetical protein J5979_07525 [Lachnospiraceae bacterium]|nr:hypothetical protein [Lachnospiraceae bacterium]
MGYQVGKEVMKYLDKGMGIQDVLINKTPEIAQTFGFNNEYIKYVVANVFATTSEEYQEYKNMVDISQKDSLESVSKGIAARLIDACEDIYVEQGTELHKLSDLNYLHSVNENTKLLANNISFFQKKGMIPSIQCIWSEHPDFENGKVYLISEFNEQMKVADKEWVQKQKKYLKEFGSFDEVRNSGNPDALRYINYTKVKYKIGYENQERGLTFIEGRKDIGDGKGGILEHLKETSHKHVIPDLKEAIAEEKVFLSYQKTLNEIYQEYASEQTGNVVQQQNSAGRKNLRGNAESVSRSPVMEL